MGGLASWSMPTYTEDKIFVHQTIASFINFILKSWWMKHWFDVSTNYKLIINLLLTNEFPVKHPVLDGKISSVHGRAILHNPYSDFKIYVAANYEMIWHKPYEIV